MTGTGIRRFLIIGGGGGGDQFTESQKERILDLIYLNNVSTIVCDPATGERGRNVAVSVKYSILTNEDVFTSANINQGIGSVLNKINLGQQTVATGNKTASLAFTLSLAYTRQDVNTNENKVANYTTYLPQWSGVSALEDFTTYAQLEAALLKTVQANSVIERVLSPNNQYPYFIVTNENPVIRDGNNFVQSLGDWGTPGVEFWKKPLNLTLANGIATGNLYLVRSRTTKTFNNLTLKSS